MHFTSEQRLDDGVLEREFTLGEIPGVLWTPRSAPAPLILIGHNGGLHKREPRLVAQGPALCGGIRLHRGRHRRSRARRPGPVPPPMSRAVPICAGRSRPASRSTRSSTPSSSRWPKGRPRNRRITLDALLALPEIDGPVGVQRVDCHRHSAGGPRAAHLSRRFLWHGFRARRRGRGSAAGQHSAAVPDAVGRRRDETAAGPQPVDKPSAPKRRRCTPTWAGTPGRRGSRWTTGPDFSPGT